LISDATASGNKEHYKTTLERVGDYYGLVMSIERFKKAINHLDEWRKSELDLGHLPDETWNTFLDEFELLDPRSFALSH
jgi:ureidoacrylate peracid hydrolase